MPSTLRTRVVNSKPSMCGIITSATTRSHPSVRRMFQASTPSVATRTVRLQRWRLSPAGLHGLGGLQQIGHLEDDHDLARPQDRGAGGMPDSGELGAPICRGILFSFALRG